MNAQYFKFELKKIKANLLGVKTQLVYNENATPFTTLNEFGNAILILEKSYNDFNVNAVWFDKKRVSVNSFNELSTLLTTKKVDFVCFTAARVANSLNESMANDKFLD